MQDKFIKEIVDTRHIDEFIEFLKEHKEDISCVYCNQIPKINPKLSEDVSPGGTMTYTYIDNIEVEVGLTFVLNPQGYFRE